MDLTDILKEKRPNLSDGSLRTYKSILTNIYRRCYPEDEEIKISKLNDDKCIIDHLKDVPYSRRKTTLAALVVLTGNKTYTKLMLQDIDSYKAKQNMQEADGKFENMIPFTEVEAILKSLEKQAKQIYMKDKLNMTDLQNIQNYILLSLTGGVYMAPRRSQDWVIKWRNYYEEKDNFFDLKGKRFVFNEFKTRKQKGQQIIEVPKPLLAILKKWIAVLPADEDYVLFDTKGNPITPSQITHRLNTIFDKPISTSMLRHIFLTSKFSGVNLKDLKDTANAMGQNNIETTLSYVKK